MTSLYQTKKLSNLIYDVGMHKGEDTLFYLKKGYNVIAFEADPDLATECRVKFADEIKNNQLVIIEGAIVDSNLLNAETNSVKFFKNKSNSVWGTVANEWAQRNENFGASSDIIDIQAINFIDCLNTYGVPYYLKIDIEGMDIICLQSLLYFSEKPDYVSIESEKISFHKLKKEFDLLTELGYYSFKAINQANIITQKLPSITNQGTHINHKFENGSSGTFGTELPKKWKTKNQIINEYRRIFWGYKLFGDYGVLPKNIFITLLLRIITKISTSPIPGWYDTHAKHFSTTGE
jgi:FkbM family methyltransferase